MLIAIVAIVVGVCCCKKSGGGGGRSSRFDAKNTAVAPDETIRVIQSSQHSVMTDYVTDMLSARSTSILGQGGFRYLKFD